MKICVQVPGRRLRRAIVELLREHGHEVPGEGSSYASCALRIVPEPLDEAEPPAMATLYLRPAATQHADADAADALREALRTRGTAVWRSPLDARTLLNVLAEHEDRATPADTPPMGAPDLGAAPHPWVVIDVNRRTLVNWNAMTRDLFQYPPVVPPGGLPMEEASLPRVLTDALLDTSEGRMPLDSLGRPYVAAWWTGESGRRVLCLLEDPEGRSAPADRQLRNLADIGRMAATLAHEIRNPVASVAGALDLIPECQDDSERNEIVAMARARLNDMRTLLDDTLRMARPLEQELESLELQALVDSALSVVTISPVFAEIEVEIDAAPDPVRVLGHVGPLQQALVNLLMNAAQAQDGRGSVRITLAADGRSGILRVHDDGPGIPDEARDQVFRPFYTTKSQGTGLGLAFVRRVVEAAGGSIYVEAVDRGASIRLQLPLDA